MAPHRKTIAPDGRFMALIWTDEPDGTPVTIVTLQGAVRDVACYALQGEQVEADAWQHIAKVGYKLTERQARAFGAGWPDHLSYRR